MLSASVGNEIFLAGESLNDGDDVAPVGRGLWRLKQNNAETRKLVNRENMTDCLSYNVGIKPICVATEAN